MPNERVRRRRPRKPCDDPRAEPGSAGSPIARVVLKSAPVIRGLSCTTPVSDPTAPEALPDDGVLGRMVDELLSDVAAVPGEECDAHRRRIDELEAIVRMKENRIAEIEVDRAQDGKLREELEATRARVTLFADWVARLSRERDQFAEIARAARDESQRLSGEVARLQQCLEALKRLVGS